VDASLDRATPTTIPALDEALDHSVHGSAAASPRTWGLTTYTTTFAAGSIRTRWFGTEVATAVGSGSFWFILVLKHHSVLVMTDSQAGNDGPIGRTWRPPQRGSSLWFVTVTAGAPRARTLGAALRKAREAKNLTVRELASRIGMSHATVSKWENAKQVPDLENVVAYLQACDVTGEARERVLQLVRGTTDPNWLVPGGSQELIDLLECERTAVEIDEWSPLLVPGILQTADYARAILSASVTLSPRELDGLIKVRVGRRKILTDVRDEEADLGPADYTALISENALRERVGGDRVLVEQLGYLGELAELPTVTIYVVPSRQDWHPGLSGPFILYRFGDASPIVHLEHHRSSAFLYDEGDILAYKAAATVIRRRAMSTEDSLRFIEQVRNEVETT